MYIYDCTTRDEFFAINDGREFQDRYALQLHIAKTHGRDRRFTLPGFCRLCNRGVDFLVDRQYSTERHEGTPIPNWRERLVCPCCKLNNRHRAMGWFISEAIRTTVRNKPVIYMMEQLSPLYQDCVARYGQCEWVGSEYLGPEVAPGTMKNGIRHEDATQLSLDSGSVNIIVSNDVLEHIPMPLRALRQMHRVLHNDGILLMTIPFCATHDKNVQRARIENGQVVHVLPPVYHGNPINPQGSLVFTDFGWEVLDDMRAEGFVDVQVVLFWSMVYGHLGGPLPLFRARKTV